MTTMKNRIILGCMTFGADPTKGGRVTDLKDCTAIFSHFSNAGYAEIDTARVYIGGAQEAFTNAAGYKGFGFKIATKQYPSPPYSHTRESLRQGLTKSLGELGTKCVDIFYLHAPDRNTTFEETLKACDEMHREGMFKELGLSNFTSFEVAEIAVLCRERGWKRPTVYQAIYNCITRKIEEELVPACRRYGLDIVIYNPIAGGLFTGGFSPDLIPATGRFSDTNLIGKMYRGRYFHPNYFVALSAISAVSEKHNLTMLEIALRWLVHHSALKIKDGNDGVIIGVSSISQLKTDLEDLEKAELPEEVVKVVDEAWEKVKADKVVDYWHGKLEWDYEWPKEKL